jgi:hypothetical protein
MGAISRAAAVVCGTTRAAAAWAEGAMYCNGALVKLGDLTSKVLQSCGDPSAVRTSTVERSAAVTTPRQPGKPSITLAEKITVVVERWDYLPTSGRLGRRLVFEDGRLVDIRVDP